MGRVFLVVDDEPAVREVAALMLEDLGCEVVTAANGSEALHRLAIDARIEAMITDINMPGMDGLTLLGEIKRRWPELPVMMVTAYGDDERRRRADEYGAAEFITKPVDFEMLKERLRQLPNGGE